MAYKQCAEPYGANKYFMVLQPKWCQFVMLSENTDKETEEKVDKKKNTYSQ